MVLTSAEITAIVAASLSLASALTAWLKARTAQAHAQSAQEALSESEHLDRGAVSVKQEE